MMHDVHVLQANNSSTANNCRGLDEYCTSFRIRGTIGDVFVQTKRHLDDGPVVLLDDAQHQLLSGRLERRDRHLVLQKKGHGDVGYNGSIDPSLRREREREGTTQRTD